VWYIFYLANKNVSAKIKEKKVSEIKVKPKTVAKEFKLPFKFNAIQKADLLTVVVLSIFPLIGLLCMYIKEHPNFLH